MAIKIRKKVEPEIADNSKKVLEPDEVINPDGQKANAAPNEDGISAEDIQNVKVPGMEDDFLRTSGTAMEWLIENRRAVGFTIGLILVIAIAAIAFYRMSENRITSQSSELLQNVFVTYSALTKEEADEFIRVNEEQMKKLGIAAEADDILRPTYTVPNNEARYKAIEAHLTKEIPNYKGEAIEAPSTLMLAGVRAYQYGAFDKENQDKSGAYESAAQKASEHKLKDIKLFADLGSVETLVDKKEFDEAINLLDKITASNSGMLAYTAYQKGRIYELKGDTEQAINAYDASINAPGEEFQLALLRLQFLAPDWSERQAAAKQKKELAKLQAQPAPAQPAPNQAQPAQQPNAQGEL